MFLLTKHAKEKIKKRLLKKKDVNPIELWKKAIEFAQNSIERVGDFIYYTNGQYTLIVTKDQKSQTKEEFIKNISQSKYKYFYVYWDGDIKYMPKHEVLLLKGYAQKNSPDVYIGNPRIAITLRPFKKSDLFPMIHRLTIKKKWLDKLLKGEKEYEVRNQIPKNLAVNDIIEFYDKKKKVSHKFRGISKSVLFQLAKKDYVYLLKLEPLDKND